MAENYDLLPSKEAYRAVKSDVTPVSAFKELIDNALDNWQRVSEKMDDITIEIIHRDLGDGEEILIRDNTGGVEEDDVSMLFALGQSQKEDITGSLGAYGIGAKKAIVNLGNKATIRSRYLRGEKGYGFTIDEEWLTDDDDWSVDKEEYENIDQGITEIRVQDLNIDWSNYSEDLEQNLAETYQRFLRNEDSRDRGDVEVIVREVEQDDGEEVVEEAKITPAEPIPWSFSPVDNYYVRKYEDIELESREFSDTVYLTISVGLMRESSAEHAGADIFCQDRKVLASVRDERAAFGTGSGSQRLKQFTGQHHRLRFVVDFYTEGQSRELPWDAQKSDIDQYNQIAQAAYSWVRRIVKPYMKAAGDFDNFATGYLAPYDEDHPHSEKEGYEGYDYTGRERVMHKPDDDYPTAKNIKRVEKISKALGIYTPDTFDEEIEPAYNEVMLRYLRTANFREDEDIEVDDVDEIAEYLTEVPSLPDNLDVEQAENVASRLQGEAETHAHNSPPQRAMNHPHWQQSLYDHYLRRALDEAGVDTALEHLESVETEEPVTDEETSDHTQTDETPDETDETTDETDETASLFDDETTQEVIEETTDTVTEVEDEDEAREVIEGALRDFGSNVGDNTGGSGVHVLRLDDDDYQELVDALGLDEDANEDEVVEALVNTMNVLRQLPRASAD